MKFFSEPLLNFSNMPEPNEHLKTVFLGESSDFTCATISGYILEFFIGCLSALIDCVEISEQLSFSPLSRLQKSPLTSRRDMVGRRKLTIPAQEMGFNSARLSPSSASFILAALLVVTQLPPAKVQAIESCTSDTYCQELYNSSYTVCSPDTQSCTNPFQQGCLATKLGHQNRLCNSDDSDNALCVLPEFTTYPELRIHHGNWESSVVMAWIYQILLMEVVRVPATVGLTSQDTKVSSFYSSNNDFLYSTVAYPYGALQMADEIDDCSLTEVPCVHILPEVWEGQFKEYWPLVLNQTIEPPAPDGLLGQSGLYIPAFTASRFPQMGIWYGLAGEANRQFLAETFLRPVTWLEYCNEISLFNCSIPSATAARFPLESEEGLYFAEGLYIGHFRATDANDCTLNPTTCTGHVVTPPCSWTSPIDAQLYWNEIVGLKRDGPLPTEGGYPDAQMMQVWKAANATNNHVIMHWYEPSPIHVEFIGTDFEFTPITFPPATVECLENRVDTQQKCSDNIEERRGNRLGACGDETQTLQRLIASIVPSKTYDTPEVDRSPAYEFIRHIQITNVNLNMIIKRWLELNNDPFGNDARQAVCEWVAENLDQIKTSIPLGYPRVMSLKSQYEVWYLYLCQAIGGFVATLAFFALILVRKYRKTKAMVFAQPIFIYLILIGFCMISVGAVVSTITPTKATCISSAWLLFLGYTIELVPVLVKTSKINDLIKSSKKQKRIVISRKTMLYEVAVIVALVVTYLIAWTVVDPPRASESRALRAGSVSVVEFDVKCASTSDVWGLVPYVWQVLLLIAAAFLAFQSRGVMAQLNESQSLAVMVYSHFLFVCLRGVCSILYVQDTLPSSFTALLWSLTYSLDALAAMSIYVFPKVLAARQAPTNYKAGMLSQADQTSEDILEDEDLDARDLSLLVCSVNMGNAGPTMDSMQALIPECGRCDEVEPIGDVTMPKGQFGLIAIGFQEATWTEKGPREASIRGDSITEQEVFNALEDHNTGQLREMVHDILGPNYFQVTDELRGQMRFHLWATRRIGREIQDFKVSGANTGIGNVLANKGAIVVTVQLKDTSLSFVAAHLAAHEGESYYNTRCENIRSILREAKTSTLSSLLDVATTSHHTFFFGDLNFRTRFVDQNKYAEDRALAADLIEFKDYGSLYEFDELQDGLSRGELLVGFNTLPCDFPPTFKVQRQEGFVYQDQRMPSWTDRILYKSSEGLGKALKPISYEACPNFITSDHKPIRGAYLVTPNGELGALRVDSEVILEFQKLRCSNLPALNSGGKSDPSLVFLWDAVEFETEWKAPFERLRKAWLRKRWPRTQCIPKTLNPYWKGEVVSLSLKNTSVRPDAMLFLAVVNSDAVGREELLGVAALNVKDLIITSRSTGESVLSFDRPLEREGQTTGGIKFNVEVKQRVLRRQSGVMGHITRGALSLFSEVGNASSQDLTL